MTEQPLTPLGIPLFLKKLLCRYARYYNGTINRFEINSNGELTLKQVEQSAEQNSKTSNEQKLPLLIVARNFYSEQAKHYPIENKKELKKLLDIESSLANKESKTFYHVWKKPNSPIEKSSTGNAQSAVNIWQFNKIVPAAYITLPESLLLAAITNVGQVLILNTTKPSYVAKGEQLIHSVSKTSVVNTAQRFAMSVGIAELAPTQSINHHSLPSMLVLGLKKLSLPQIASFIKLPNVENRIDLIKKIAVPALAVLTLYLVTTSTYLTYKKYDLQQQFSVQRNNVTQALAQQVEFDTKTSHYNALKQFTATQKNSSPFWLMMAEVFPTAQFTNIRINNERFVLRGSAAKATELLENLSQYKQVNDARFDFPVRKVREKENFVISFKLVNTSEVIHD